VTCLVVVRRVRIILMPDSIKMGFQTVIESWITLSEEAAK